jgi:phosphohistidine phosphatase SixA
MLRAALAAILLLASLPASATEAGWALLRDGGQVVLISHANASGITEPADFDPRQCSTQRNLSDRGRQQGRRMGALFPARAAPVDEVLTAPTCRAYITATLAFGNAEVFDALDDLAPGSEAEAEQLDALREHVLDYMGAGNLVMVTHPATIQALVGVVPRDGEAIILSRSPEEIGVAARITFN